VTAINSGKSSHNGGGTKCGKGYDYENESEYNEGVFFRFFRSFSVFSLNLCQVTVLTHDIPLLKKTRPS
jgi:hypothetical protein